MSEEPRPWPCEGCGRNMAKEKNFLVFVLTDLNEVHTSQWWCRKCVKKHGLDRKPVSA